jgi:hypothetical protein
MSEAAALEPSPGREVYVRHARVDGRSVARLRAVDHGGRCFVEAEVWPNGAATPSPAGPYAFPSSVEATGLVTHAVEAFISLSYDVAAT